MLYLSEYSDVGSTTRGAIAIPLEPALETHVLEVSAGNVQSATFEPQTCVITLLSDEDCLYKIGKDPDATDGGNKLIAKTEKVITVQAGSDLKIAVTAANSGSVTGMDSLESLLKLLASPADAQKQFAAMKTNTDKMTAAAKDLRAAGAENKVINDQLVVATEDALNAKAVADKAAADVAAREAALDKDMQDHADKAKADLAAAYERAKALGAREAQLTASLADLNKRGTEMADLAASMDAKAKELADRETAVAASQADYEARIAKLKALTA